MSALDQAPVRVAITGAAGAIGYSMIFRVARHVVPNFSASCQGFFIVFG